MPNFRANVTKGLQDCHWTQKELATAAGIHEVQLSRWMTASRPSINSAMLAKIMGAIEHKLVAELRMVKRRPGGK